MCVCRRLRLHLRFHNGLHNRILNLLPWLLRVIVTRGSLWYTMSRLAGILQLDSVRCWRGVGGYGYGSGICTVGGCPRAVRLIGPIVVLFRLRRLGVGGWVGGIRGLHVRASRAVGTVSFALFVAGYGGVNQQSKEGQPGKLLLADWPITVMVVV
jgi:hypothetical protein